MKVAAASAWLFYITKLTALHEPLSISFKLLDRSPAVQASANTGQFLTAIEFEDGARQVHIGTQDEECMAWCGKAAWMPSRLVVVLAADKLRVSTIEADGLLTRVPALLAGEGFYRHYVLAKSPRSNSVEYPDEWDVATWYTVD